MSLQEINPSRNYTPEDIRVHAELARLNERLADPEIAKKTASSLLMLDKELFDWSSNSSDGELRDQLLD